jgi:hypothetical protein
MPVDGLSTHLRGLGEFRLIALTVGGVIEQCIDDSRDAIVRSEREPPRRVAFSKGLTVVSGC